MTLEYSTNESHQAEEQILTIVLLLYYKLIQIF